MRQEQKATVGLAKGGHQTNRVIKKPSSIPTLAEAGINKNLAQEGRKLGALGSGQARHLTKR